jgi:hypothetical protein
MLFVCLSHFASNALTPARIASISPVLKSSGQLAGVVSMIASPSFIIVSAIVVGYLCRIEPTGMSALRRKLIDRGLFLLLVGHAVQVPAYTEGNLSATMRLSFITDVIAVAVIVGPTLLMRWGPRTRLVAGGLLLLMSWIAAAALTSRTPVANFTTSYLVGSLTRDTWTGFPLLPWLAVYLMATVLGERIARHARALEMPRAERMLYRMGGLAIAAGAAITVVRHVLRASLPAVVSVHNEAATFFAVNQKYPPGPVYLLLFGGAGLILISCAFAFARLRRWELVTRPISGMGRSSFFVFVLQGYVYYILLPAIGLPFPVLWPLYYVMSILLFAGAAALWNSFDANQYLTIGLWRTVPMARAFRSKLRTAFALR